MLPTYTSSSTFTISCADGLDGVSVTRTATARSIISQLDADKKAAVAAQLTAYEALQCSLPPGPAPTIYYNLTASGSRSCTRCSGPFSIPVTVPAAAFYSLVSQAAADAAAAAELARLISGTNCGNTVYYNTAQTATAYCPVTAEGSPSSSTVLAGVYCSDTSQEDADAQAYAAAYAAAAAALACTYYNTQQTYTATCPKASDPTKTKGPPYTAVVNAGTYSSSVSTAAANALALAAAQAAAIAGLTCYTYGNVEQVSYSGATPDCAAVKGSGYAGPAIDPVVVAADLYFSNTSQGDADGQAQAAAIAEYDSRLFCYPVGYI